MATLIALLSAFNIFFPLFSFVFPAVKWSTEATNLGWSFFFFFFFSASHDSHVLVFLKYLMKDVYSGVFLMLHLVSYLAA